MIDNSLPASRKNKKIRIAVVLIAVIIIAIAIPIWNYSRPVSRCSRAISLGSNYLENGQYEEAIAEFSSAVRIDPKQPEPYIRLGNTYLEYANRIKANSTADNNPSSEQHKKLMKMAADSYKQAEVAISNLPDKAGIAAFSTPVIPMSMTLDELKSASEQIQIEIDDLENNDTVDQTDIGSGQSDESAVEETSSAQLSLRTFPKENLSLLYNFFLTFMCTLPVSCHALFCNTVLRTHSFSFFTVSRMTRYGFITICMLFGWIPFIRSIRVSAAVRPRYSAS